MNSNQVDAPRRKTALGERIRNASISAAQILRNRTAHVSSKPGDHWRAFAGEFLGTAMFMYLNMVLSVQPLVGGKEKPSLLQSALIAGGGLTVFIFSLGHVSGGHLNPAVTLTIMSVKALPVTISLLYIFFQLLGSIVATGLFALTLPAGAATSAAMFGLVPSLGLGTAFMVQLLVSALLCWVVLATGVDSETGEPRNFLAALPIGIALAVGVAVAAPLIGSSMNPAGSFGAILLYGYWSDSWIYLAGPLVSALLVGVLYKFLFMRRKVNLDIVGDKAAAPVLPVQNVF